MARDAWLAEDGRHRGAYARMCAISLRYERARALSAQQQGEGFPLIREAHIARRKPLAWITGLAASVIACVLLTFYLQSGPRDVHSTRLGEVLRLPLQDGSIVTLNSNSEIRVKFDGKTRSISLLRGEAMFDVAKDKQHPFVVSAGDTWVRAVGTSFTVNRRDRVVNVLVREGIVKVVAGTQAPLRLVANHKAQVGADDKPVVREVGDSEISRDLAWREGMIAFDGDTLAQAASEFSRYSSVRIVIDDPEIAGKRVVGLYSATDPVGFSRVVAQSMGLSAEESDGAVHLGKNNR